MRHFLCARHDYMHQFGASGRDVPLRRRRFRRGVRVGVHPSRCRRPAFAFGSLPIICPSNCVTRPVHDGRRWSRGRVELVRCHGADRVARRDPTHSPVRCPPHDQRPSGRESDHYTGSPRPSRDAVGWSSSRRTPVSLPGGVWPAWRCFARGAVMGPWEVAKACQSTS